jgi:heme exporter protein B
MLAASAVLLPVYSLLYSVFLLKDGFFLVIILGTAGYALAGTLLAGMSAQSRARDSLLPLLLLPVTFPLILASVKASTGLLQGFALADVQTWISLLVVYDILFIVLGLLLFERIVEE